mmetsp:Transcript_43618/g.64744  ORF Transcript_43618/g.64744 Transcript_43618/m.64744 type:complete len:126 (+) Transcript_43618:93-470(+)
MSRGLNTNLYGKRMSLHVPVVLRVVRKQQIAPTTQQGGSDNVPGLIKAGDDGDNRGNRVGGNNFSKVLCFIFYVSPCPQLEEWDGGGFLKHRYPSFCDRFGSCLTTDQQFLYSSRLLVDGQESSC